MMDFDAATRSLDTSVPIAPHLIGDIDSTLSRFETESASSDAERTSDDTALETAVDYILDDCFFRIGQVVGGRKAIQRDVIIWWRDRYREKFLRAMRMFGNTWLRDRDRVMTTIALLANRAVLYAGDKPAVDREAAAKASADMEKYCTTRATRRSRSTGAQGPAMYAGYWCVL